MERLWSDTDRENPQYSEDNLSYMDWPRIESVPPPEKIAFKQPDLYNGEVL
jgi:hypothetical protein